MRARACGVLPPERERLMFVPYARLFRGSIANSWSPVYSKVNIWREGTAQAGTWSLCQLSHVCLSPSLPSYSLISSLLSAGQCRVSPCGDRPGRVLPLGICAHVCALLKKGYPLSLSVAWIVYAARGGHGPSSFCPDTTQAVKRELFSFSIS